MLEPSFSLQLVQELATLEIDNSTGVVLHNLVMKETQLMKGTITWRGSREKDPLMMQMLIESTTSCGNMVMDCTTSIGTSLFIVVYFQLYLCS
jgi:hypothetical protein